MRRNKLLLKLIVLNMTMETIDNKPYVRYGTFGKWVKLTKVGWKFYHEDDKPQPSVELLMYHFLIRRADPDTNWRMSY